MYGINGTGAATGFSLAWPAIKNYHVYYLYAKKHSLPT